MRRNLHPAPLITLLAKNTLGRAGVIYVLVAAVFFPAFCVPSYSQSAPNSTTLLAGELLRKAIDRELKAQSDDHSHWMYHAKAGTSGNVHVKVVVETLEGDIDRLQSVNGQPITSEQEIQEDRRIETLLHKPNERRKRQHEQEEDAQQTEHLFGMIPSAVIASYGEQKGELVEILFRPNPSFHPSSHEDAVFHEMAGRIWINQREDRLAEIEGHLIEDVKFAGGLLGHLDKGGEFHVRQSEVAPGHWEIVLLHVNMNGKALFFKTIAVHEDEIRTNFLQVPDNLTLAEAAEELQKLSAERSVAAEMHIIPKALKGPDKN
jgi:hypothetical protein